MTIRQPVADLLAAPGGARDRQLIFGQTVERFESFKGYSFVRSRLDGYVGYVADAALGAESEANHRVIARATHVYAQPDIKAPERMSLTMLSRLSGVIEGSFLRTGLGWVPACHVAPADHVQTERIATARTFLGTPYLWGGNSAWGIDCSGLVQAVWRAAGRACPGDSDMQQALGIDATGEDPQPGDLLFWKGHVALVSAPDRMIHANAHHMAVTEESIADAIQRIAANGDGPVVAHRREPNSVVDRAAG